MQLCDMDVYFELAQGSSMRLCRNLEEQFPVLRGWQLELMRYLCLIAYESEIYDGVCEGTWLRTTIAVERAPNPVFAAFSPEHTLLAEMAEIPAESRVAYWRMLRERLSKLSAKIRIHSNVLPRDAYLAPEIQHQSWLRDSSTCCVSRRRFYPSEVLARAVEENSSLKETVQEWSTNGGTCVLGMHLRRSHAPHAQLRNELRVVEFADVERKGKLGQGAEGSVDKVSWRNGTYAMKLFNQENYVKECEVALRVLHPHVVHPFGRTFDVDESKECLLMEMLSEDLFRFAVEKNRSHGDWPLFSRLDAIDVLQQLASAMDFLHSQNVVHCDLKTNNILISHFEISDRSRHILAKITDFGNAEFIVPGKSFKPGGNGTTRYAAPEVLKWRNNKDLQFLCPEKLDVYSFGVMAFEVLTGHEPYNRILGISEKERIMHGDLKPSDDSVQWSRMRMNCPVELIRCLERCWELDPSKRPSFGELCDVLQTSRLKVQLLERKAVDLRKFLAVCFSAFVIVFIVLWLQTLVVSMAAGRPFIYEQSRGAFYRQ